ncbi:DUF2975 domain-containing protein [Bacillus sp. APMAM]|nr:DUF2975 domain-containing protein [Bacillus sp. APMAM]RTZ56842.1 DUF2975 domain-containing protein [Bacillus sp. SAJ1]
MKRGTTTGLKVAIMIIGVIVLGACIFGLPKIAKYSSEMNPEFAYLRLPVLFGLYATALPSFLALFHGMKLLNYIEKENAFSELTIISLKRIKKCALTIFCLYIIGMIFLLKQNALHPGIAVIGFVICFVTIVVSLFTAVLQNLLKSIMEIKNENDLTV